MRLSLTRAILEHLAEGGKMMIDVFFPYHYPHARISREFFGIDRKKCPHKFSPVQKKSLSRILSRLRSEGLVLRSGSKKKSVWNLTGRGKEILDAKAVKSHIDIDFALPPEDGKIRIVSFDIPEKERAKRNWLRTRLLASKFKPLHKSVWMAKRPLAEELVEEIDDMDLSDYVHIVSLDKKGTVE